MAAVKFIIMDTPSGVGVKIESDEPMDVRSAHEWTDAQKLAMSIFIQLGPEFFQGTDDESEP